MWMGLGWDEILFWMGLSWDEMNGRLSAEMWLKSCLITLLAELTDIIRKEASFYLMQNKIFFYLMQNKIFPLPIRPEKKYIDKSLFFSLSK